MKRALILLLPLLLSCGRPLTENEVKFAREIHGDQVDTAKISITNGALVGKVTHYRPARPRLSCTQRLFPPESPGLVTTSPGGVVLFNHIFIRKDLYRQDFFADLPNRMSLYDAMLFAHEMVHVWQWQNRATTGYSPWKAATEHTPGGDPYLFDLTTKTALSDYGYEQQGAIVEEYLCCRTLAPNAPRTQRLHAMLSGAFPVADMSRKLADKITLPWRGAKVEGICN